MLLKLIETLNKCYRKVYMAFKECYQNKFLYQTKNAIKKRDF